MRNLFILTLSFLSFFVSGQSARKLNKQLQLEYTAMLKVYDNQFLKYDSLTSYTKGEQKAFLQKKKVAEQERNLLRESIRLCLRSYNRLVDLDFTKDIAFSKASIEGVQVPDLRFNELTAAEDRYKMTDLLRASYPITMPSKKIKQQNVEYADYIQRLNGDISLLSNVNNDFSEINQLFHIYGSKYDSITIVLRGVSTDVMAKTKVLDKAFLIAKENYRSKGPKGFNEQYAYYFPEVFPNKKQDLVIDEFTRIGDFEEAAPPPPKSVEFIQQEEPVIYDFVDEPADFPGGRTAMTNYLANNIKYPENTLKLGLQGKCYLKFVVSENGYISNVKVLRGVPDCPECDKEAIRVVKSMPNWIPGKLNGKAVNSVFNLPVSFKL